MAGFLYLDHSCLVAVILMLYLFGICLKPLLVGFFSSSNLDFDYICKMHPVASKRIEALNFGSLWNNRSYWEWEREIWNQSTQRAFGCAFKMHLKPHRITIFESNSLESKANAECIPNKSLLWACEIKCRLAHKYIIQWQSATKCRCIEINNEFIFVAHELFVYALHSPTWMSVSLDYVAHFA